MLQQLKRALTKLLLARLDSVGLALHRAALGAYIALSEDDPIGVYMESGPSLFCSCCGERWHAFSRASCPNGCPWIYTSFRAPAWAEDEELLEAVQEFHEALCAGRDRCSCEAVAEGEPGVTCWPTSDGKVPRA